MKWNLLDKWSTSKEKFFNHGLLAWSILRRIFYLSICHEMIGFDNVSFCHWSSVLIFSSTYWLIDWLQLMHCAKTFTLQRCFIMEKNSPRNLNLTFILWRFDQVRSNWLLCRVCTFRDSYFSLKTFSSLFFGVALAGVSANFFNRLMRFQALKQEKQTRPTERYATGIESKSLLQERKVQSTEDAYKWEGGDLRHGLPNLQTKILTSKCDFPKNVPAFHCQKKY